MFVIAELLDTVEIKASSQDKVASVIEKIQQKYIGKLVDELGLGIHFHEMKEISEYFIKSEILAANVRFEIIFYRFYYDEVLEGKVIFQDEDRIVVSDNFFNKYEAQSMDLFDNCEFDESNGNCWVWNYKGNKFVISNGTIVKFKIKRMRFEDTTVEICINDQGLGPKSWWN